MREKTIFATDAETGKVVDTAKAPVSCVNLLVGGRFDYADKEYVITWNDSVHIRATPLFCNTGLTSKEFKIDDVGLANIRDA